MAELLVHHNTLNSKTLTHQLGGGEGGNERFGKWGSGRQTGLEVMTEKDSGDQNSGPPRNLPFPVTSNECHANQSIKTRTNGY